MVSIYLEYNNKAGYTAQDAPKMRLFTFENNTGHTDLRTDRRTDGHDLI